MKTSHVLSAVQLVKSPRVIFKMIQAIIKGEYKPSFKIYIYFLLLLVYIISPIDGLPDFIPFVGWVDDGVLLALFIKSLSKEASIYASQLKTVPIEIIKR